MFTGMRMQNFKSWVDTDEVRLAPLTAIFGANSSGKSSLLQMLLLLKQTTESNDRRLVLKTGSMQDGYVNLGTVGEITHAASNEMTLGVRWQLPTRNSAEATSMSDPLAAVRELDFSTIIFSDHTNTYVRRIRYASVGNGQMDVVMERANNNRYTIRVKLDGKEPPRPQGRPRVLMSPEKCYGFSDEAIRYYQDAGYLSDIVLAFEQQFRRLHYLGPLRGYPERTYNWANESPESVGMRGELAIAALLSGKAKGVYPPGRRGGHQVKQVKMEKRIADWLVQMGMAHSFKTHQINSNQYEVRLQRTRTSHEVLIPDMGFGVSQVLPVLVQCYYAPPGSTLIFEQPEIHLHPAVQSALADVFIDVMQHRQMQIIIESHSEHLLRRLQRRIAEKSLTHESIALYFCEMQEGQSRIRELEVDMFGSIRNWPRDFFGDLTEELLVVMEAQFEAAAGAGG